MLQRRPGLGPKNQLLRPFLKEKNVWKIRITPNGPYFELYGFERKERFQTVHPSHKRPSFSLGPFPYRATLKLMPSATAWSGSFFLGKIQQTPKGGRHSYAFLIPEEVPMRFSVTLKDERLLFQEVQKPHSSRTQH